MLVREFGVGWSDVHGFGNLVYEFRRYFFLRVFCGFFTFVLYTNWLTSLLFFVCVCLLWAGVDGFDGSKCEIIGHHESDHYIDGVAYVVHVEIGWCA